MTGLRKNINLNDQIADVGFTFIECVFLSEFHNLLIFLLPIHPFVQESIFYHDYIEICGFKGN